MSTQFTTERSFAGISQLSLRSIFLGILGSCVITASSMYVALRMSALPWPTIFVAVLSMALLKAFGRTSLNEINATQTAMSAGAMVAGGLAFTLPGFWITGIWHGPAMFREHFWQVLAIALAGVVIGTLLTWFMRRRFVVTESLPYPIGAAAAETIKVGDAGGRKSALLFGTMLLTAAYTYCRDFKQWLPAALSSQWLNAKNLYLGLWLSPMAAGIGYMIGALYTGVWFLGAVFSYLLIIPFAPVLKLLPSVPAAVSFKNAVGIGLMVGTGIGILISYLASQFRKIGQTRAVQAATRGKIKNSERIWTLISFALAFILSILCGLAPLPSVLLMLGVWAAAAMAATITGQTGINPMEIFGIIILLAIRLIVPVNAASAFFIAAVVAVTCGYAGDLLNDYKAGHVLGTNPVAQLILHIIGGIIGAVIASLAMFAIIGQFGGVGAEHGLPAGQAFAVSQMVKGIEYPWVFASAAILGALLYLLRIPVMTLGIGMYLPFAISAIVFLGGMVRFVTDRLSWKTPLQQRIETGNIVASGFLGGEGITGVAIAIYLMLTKG